LSPSLKALLDTSKKESRLLGEVQRLLLDPGRDSDRSVEVLHPSEISHDDWCHRAAYYQLKGIKPNKSTFISSWRMQGIFAEGHEIHHKWQNWFWDIGRLAGVFYCYNCKSASWEESPTHCPRCGASRNLMRYDEVPLFHDRLRIAGHSDGQDIDGSNIEIKSVSLGTLRFEAPDLLKAHTYKFQVRGSTKEFVDLDGLWDSIRRPFPTHIRQGHLYSFISQSFVDGAHATNGDEIYLYESKWNQKAKEFVVKFRQDRIQDILDRVKEVNYALSENHPPTCIFGGCERCRNYEGENNAPQHRRLPSRVGQNNQEIRVKRLPRRVQPS